MLRSYAIINVSRFFWASTADTAFLAFCQIWLCLVQTLSYTMVTKAVIAKAKAEDYPPYW